LKATVLSDASAITSLRIAPSQEGAPSDYDWIAGTRAGNYKAFDAMFVAYADPLCAYAYGLLRSRDDAQEIVQDLFLWIWENRTGWDVPGELRTYLYRSVRNRAISRMRHRRVQHLFRLRSAATDSLEMPPRAVLPDAQDRLEAAELSRAIVRALETLPERCRQVFLLSRQHHMSYAEVAQVMQISPKTVENHMARALAGLRAALGDLRP
jgi:RNA polymerase sigma-70 factor (ECF subfamily)